MKAIFFMFLVALTLSGCSTPNPKLEQCRQDKMSDEDCFSHLFLRQAGRQEH